jgi:uncharacterized membrane protein
VIRLFLVLHVLGAIVAVGFSLSYGLWLARGDAAGATERAFALRTISWIDRRMTTPAYVLQFVTGLVLVWLLGWEVLRQSWLELSLLLYVVLTVLAIARFAPAHRRQSALAQQLADGADVDTDYEAAAATARSWGIAVTILTLAIVVLMVAKPVWW